jgi:hypothetical protein
MRLTADFPGESIRFEGDRTIFIDGLPDGAQIERATITLTPAAAPGRPLFEETLTFTGNVGEFGMTKVLQPGVASGILVTHPSLVEVNFHTRRTLAVVRGSNLSGSELLVDLGGGVFMGINEYGAVAASEDAELYQLPASGAVPSLLASKFRLLSTSGVPQPTLNVTQVTVRTAPENVTLALAGMPPFWVHVGEMTTAVTTPNFAEFLQLYLEEAEVNNGRYHLPLIIHSDNLTRLSVGVDIEYTRQQSALPVGVNEVALPYGFDSVAQADSALMQVTLPVGAEVTAATVRVLGAFDGSRIAFGPIGPLSPVAAALITGGISQAQPILLPEDTAATAIDLLLSSASRTAVLDLNLMADVGGKPFADPLLPSPVPLELDRELAAKPTWISARLPREFQFRAGERYWLVVQAREGEATWHAGLAANGEGLQYSSSGGLAWRETKADSVAGRVAGFFRLRYMPDQFQMPLSVQVGEGETAVSVSLDRFQPLGRIDFTIDFPEFVAAINQAARRAEAAAYARGEQLKNNDFADWTTVGERFGPLQDADNLPGISTITIAPNGEWAIIGREIGGAAVVSLPLHEVRSTTFPAPASRRRVAISQDSQRIYLINEGYEESELWLIEAATFAPLGAPMMLSQSVRCLTLSPDGQTLYLGGSSEVRVLGTAILAELLATETAVNPTDAEIEPPFILDNGFTPLSLAVSADGRRLYVAASQANRGNFYAFDAANHQPLASLLLTQSNLTDMALTPDGRRALILNEGAGSVSLIDTVNLRHEHTLALPRPENSELLPVAVEIEPNGRRAFVAHRGSASISVIDLQALQGQNPVAVGTSSDGDLDLAVTPSGDRLYLALQNSYPTGEMSGLRFLPLGRQQPDHWALTTGFVLPVPFIDPFHLTAVLGPLLPDEQALLPARPSALSQAAAVIGGYTYDFSFWGLSNSQEAVAEVIWRGDVCAIQRTDRIPIQLPEIDARIADSPETISSGRATHGPPDRMMTVNVPATVARQLPELLFHRARLQAPPGATQAEIRFLVPPGFNAAVDSVSFQATADPIANSDLLMVQDGALAGWQLSPASASGVNLHVIEDGSVELANSEAGPIALVQSFPVTAGQPILLGLRGGLGTPQLAAGAPSLRLEWLDEVGQSVGESRLSVLAGQQEHTLETAVPIQAASAELHLELPPGSRLAVRQIFLTPVEMVNLPIHFLAHAPGRLTVIGFDVAYDLGEVALTPPPPEGFCPPTPPGRGVSGKGNCCQWCQSSCAPCSDEGEAITQARPAPGPLSAITPRRQAAVIAVAPPPTPQLTARVRQPALIREVETAVAPLLTATRAEWAALSPELAARSLTLGSIRGIADRRTHALTAMGVDSITRLAEADPERIAAVLRGVTQEMATGFVAEARTITTDANALPAPLVSCIMPTYDRRPFVPQAIAFFLRQDYPNRELIILDDGTDPIGDLVPADKRIRYLRLPQRLSIGSKRNLGGQEASGPILASWDDDVWYAPWRLSYQVGALIQFGVDVNGLDNMLHYDPAAGRAWHSVRPSGSLPWMPGSTFCYRKDFWLVNPFPDRQPGEDIRFLRRLPTAKIMPLQSVTWLVDIIHGGNVSPKPIDSPLWFPVEVAEIEELLGDDLAFYARRKPARSLG